MIRDRGCLRRSSEQIQSLSTHLTPQENVIVDLVTIISIIHLMLLDYLQKLHLYQEGVLPHRWSKIPPPPPLKNKCNKFSNYKIIIAHLLS